MHVRDLNEHPFPHLEEANLAAFYTPADQHTPENKEAVRHSDQAIAEIQDADIIVIGVPFYNFGIPSALKAWVDHITRVNVTFRYSEAGIEGLIKDKVVYLALASGGIYSSGPMQPYDFAAPYMTSLLGFLGITDLTVFRVEGAAYPGQEEAALQKGIDSIVL